MAISKLEKIKILTTIDMMLQSGSNVKEALIFFRDNDNNSEDLNNALDDIIKIAIAGKDLEKGLLKNGIINNFQYSLLKASPNVNEAYGHIIDFDNDKNEATAFYMKKISITGLLYFALLYAVDSISNLFLKIYRQLERTNKDWELNSYVDFIISNKDVISLFSFLALLLMVASIYFYFYTHKNDIKLHYKIFKYRGLLDNIIYLKVINTALSMGSTTSKTMQILSENIEPESARNSFLEIKKYIEKENYIEIKKLFDDLHFNELAVFLIINGVKSGKSKEGFLNAEKVTEKYIEATKPIYLEMVGFVFFLANAILIASFGLFVLLAEQQIMG